MADPVCCQCGCNLKYDSELGSYCGNIECIDNHNWELLMCSCYSCNNCGCYFFRCPSHHLEVLAQKRIGIETVRAQKHKLTRETETNIIQQILNNEHQGMPLTEDDKKLINEIEQTHLHAIKGV